MNEHSPLGESLTFLMILSFSRPECTFAFWKVLPAHILPTRMRVSLLESLTYGHEWAFAIRKVLPAPWCRQECVFSFRKVLERLFVSTCMVKVRCSSAFVKYSFASEIEWDCHKTLNREKTHIKTLWECHFGAKLDGMDRLFDEHEW